MSNYSEAKVVGYSLTNKTGNKNLKRYKATLDYSLDLIKFQQIYREIYNNSEGLFYENSKAYSDAIINVTFEYSVKEFNRTNKNTYVKIGHHIKDLQLEDCICVINGELIAVEVACPVSTPVGENVLGKYFYLKNGKYEAKKNIKNTRTVGDIRKDLYCHGFKCNGISYVRWKRSSGSARVGKCLFIDENLFKAMHDWELCGLEINTDDNVDLAALESYISLTSSSIIDTINIEAENILIIDDYDSLFYDDVISVEDRGGELVSTPKKIEISNSIWDGQGIIDISLMGQYQDKGMLLLRNRFFKCCCFNGNIQQWFHDNHITEISQLNGFTLAKDISEVKLITTPNSIKYLKFSNLEKWLELLEPTFGIVKYEKPTYFMNGKLVQTHYQLINTIQLSRVEMKNLLKPTFNLMKQLRLDPAVLRYWINYNIEDEIEISPIKSKTDIIYKMLSINDKFSETKLYYDFKMDYLKSFTKNLKCGHILVEGNYSTICGNPIEMLQSSIGKFDGHSQMQKNCVYSTRFNWEESLLGSRSPHITVSNVLVTKNKYNCLIEKYMNPSDEIVYINSIDENILQQLAGCDMDSDTMMLTNNPVLINAAKKNDRKFKVAVCNVKGMKTQRKYNAEDCADLDIKTSRNLIGDIINLSQELNTMIWELLYRGYSIDDNIIQNIYFDICKLSIMSGLEIDKAKKEFIIDSAKELKKIRKKYDNIQDGKRVKPNFFAHIAKQKGYYTPDTRIYPKFNTSMDYLQSIINSFRLSKNGKPKVLKFIDFSEIIKQDTFNYDNVNDRMISAILNKIDNMNQQLSAIYTNEFLSNQEKYFITQDIRQETIEYINNINFNQDTMIALLKTIEKDENKKIKRLIFYMLFGYPNSSFYDVVTKSREKMQILIQDNSGNVDIFNEKFKKIKVPFTLIK